MGKKVKRNAIQSLRHMPDSRIALECADAWRTFKNLGPTGSLARKWQEYAMACEDEFMRRDYIRALRKQLHLHLRRDRLDYPLLGRFGIPHRMPAYMYAGFISSQTNIGHYNLAKRKARAK